MKKQPLIILTVFLLLSLLLFLNSNFPPVKFISGIAQNVFSPAKSFLYGLKVSVNKSNDGAEIQKLKEENRNLNQKLIDFVRIKNDNEALTSQFETAGTKSYKLMPAKVLGFLGALGHPVKLIINKGQDQGIKQGMAVIFNNNMVGKIGQVSASYSQVLLPLNEAFSTLGKTSEGSVLGVAKGEEGFILFDRAAINENITQGELVLTKGDVNENGFGVPPDLVIGKISSVNKNENQPFQTAKIESLINFPSLEIIFVMLSV